MENAAGFLRMWLGVVTRGKGGLIPVSSPDFLQGLWAVVFMLASVSAWMSQSENPESNLGLLYPRLLNPPHLRRHGGSPHFL